MGLGGVAVILLHSNYLYLSTIIYTWKTKEYHIDISVNAATVYIYTPGERYNNINIGTH